VGEAVDVGTAVGAEVAVGALVGVALGGRRVAVASAVGAAGMRVLWTGVLVSAFGRVLHAESARQNRMIACKNRVFINNLLDVCILNASYITQNKEFAIAHLHHFIPKNPIRYALKANRCTIIQ
jgi:hypothetical protein